MRRIHLLTIITILCCILIFGASAAYAEGKGPRELQQVEELPYPDTVEGDADAAGFVIAELESPLSFHTLLQSTILENGYKKVNRVADGKKELSIPRGIVITWKNDLAKDASYVISVGTQEDLSDAKQFTVTEPANENGVYNYSIQNLYLGQEYFYRIATEDGQYVSDTHSFTTDTVPPRNLYVDGVTNVRDMGGWVTQDGEVIKQGLLYRCGQLNTDGTQDACITQAGIETMLDEFGIKTEIDLRCDETQDNENGGIKESMLGDSVEYISIPMIAVDTLNEEPWQIKAFFDVLSDESKYPIAFHCKIGTDRTGAMTYLLMGMLGVSMDDIYTEFTFSNTGNIGSPRGFDRLKTAIKNNFTEPGGETVQESCTNYLLSIGVTQEQLAAIRDILLESGPEAQAGSSTIRLIEIISPATFHSELQKEVLDAGYEKITDYYDLDINAKVERGLPEGITVSWTYDASELPEMFTVSVSMNEDMSDALEYEAVPFEEDGVFQYAIQNLFLGTTYYYTVSDGMQTSDIGSFTVDDQGPRNMYVDGVTNIRDLGGWKTNSGEVIPQGRIYRSGQLNIENTQDLCITEAGIRTMLNDLHIRTEIDIRGEDENGGITVSPLGESVNYCFIPLVYADLDPDNMRTVFELLTHEENYPLIYHCKIGTDRTGFVTYLIYGLLDVPEETIYTDYVFSNLGLIDGNRNHKRLVKGLKENFGVEELTETPNYYAREYLRSIGVADEQMDKIVEILMGK